MNHTPPSAAGLTSCGPDPAGTGKAVIVTPSSVAAGAGEDSRFDGDAGIVTTAIALVATITRTTGPTGKSSPRDGGTGNIATPMQPMLLGSVALER